MNDEGFRPTIHVVDYGMGNLFSVERSIERAGGRAIFTDSPAVIAGAERIVLPGVGSFGDGIANLKARGLDDSLRAAANGGTAILGICLGMQLMMGIGEEFGLHEGLGLVPGRCVRLPDPDASGPAYKIPHVGWNAIVTAGIQPPSGDVLSDDRPEAWASTPLAGLTLGAFVYFVHSFVVVPDSPEHVLAETVYGSRRFCSVVRSGSVVGCQFHPELSGEAGLTIMRNFMGTR